MRTAIIGFALIGSIIRHPERDNHSEIPNILVVIPENPSVDPVAAEEFSHVLRKVRFLDARTEEPLAKNRNAGRSLKIRRGDLVSLSATEFDGEIPGQFSDENPEPRVGRVMNVSKKDVARIRWLGDELEFKVRTNKLKLEVRKPTIAGIIVLLVEGEQVAFESRDRNA